ncbi:MAG: hypothetical protein IPL53_18555 [Ignavibacteria bacterium]|nr:hypothetical protein [Ignavibacteria bacterium]
MKYTFNNASNTDDEVSLHIFSSGVPSIEPAPVIGPLTGAGTDAADIGRFALRQGSESSAPNLKIDEIFTGTSWNGVLPGRNVFLRFICKRKRRQSVLELGRGNQ